MICFHGTTRKGLNSILNNSGVKPTSPWTVSDNDGAMYVWPSDKLENQYDFEEKETMVCHAFESAEIQAVFSQETEVFVLELEIDNDLLEDDYSCDNMSDVASLIDMNDFDKSMIKNVYKFKLNLWSFPFIVAGLLSNDCFNKYSVDPDLLEVAESLGEECYREPTEFYEFETLKLSDLI